MLGWDSTGAGAVLSVSRGGGGEGTVVELLQQFPMRRYETFG